MVGWSDAALTCCWPELAATLLAQNVLQMARVCMQNVAAVRRTVSEETTNTCLMQLSNIVQDLVSNLDYLFLCILFRPSSPS